MTSSEVSGRPIRFSADYYIDAVERERENYIENQSKEYKDRITELMVYRVFTELL